MKHEIDIRTHKNDINPNDFYSKKYKINENKIERLENNTKIIQKVEEI